MTRVAFTLFGVGYWTGGTNYLRNLLSALAELPHRPIQALLFIGPGTPDEAVDPLRPYLSEPPVLVAGWAHTPIARARRLFGSAVLQKDTVSLRAFKARGVDVVFHHAAWYGLRFPLPTLAWIADFQDKHLPHMFSWANRRKRDFGYEALTWCAEGIMLSSEDARRDCGRYFPRSRGKQHVLPFRVRIDPDILSVDPPSIVREYGLPDRFFYLPNQLWRHKNHILVIEALRSLKRRGERVVVAASGSPQDHRNPGHPQRVLDLARAYGLQHDFRFLGLIPYHHIMPLMRASIAVLNPSLFEGWSTTVEEARAVGVPLLLSDLTVHREQTQGYAASFFDPRSPDALAALLVERWSGSHGPCPPVAESLARYRVARLEFAEGFAHIVQGLADA